MYYGLPCGGTVELMVEPEPDLATFEELSARVYGGQLVRRSVGVGRPGNSIRDGAAGDAVQWEGAILTTLHGPAWRLLVVGAAQVSSYLAPMAQALDYQVTRCEPRAEYASAWNVPGTTLLASMAHDAAIELKLDPHCAVVALTHEAKLDDMLLLEALKSPAFYVGALGSVANSERRMQYFDLSESEVGRLHAPIGLPTGSRTPPEIAIAILAEMTAVAHGLLATAGALPQRIAAHFGCSIAEAWR